MIGVCICVYLYTHTHTHETNDSYLQFLDFVLLLWMHAFCLWNPKEQNVLFLFINIVDSSNNRVLVLY